jgi:fermentation-respiration switch protein FrsA (DUF1100 family)
MLCENTMAALLTTAVKYAILRNRGKINKKGNAREIKSTGLRAVCAQGLSHKARVMDILIIALCTVGAIAVLQLIFGIFTFLLLCKPIRKKRKYKEPIKIEREAIRSKNKAAFLEHKPEDVSIQSADGIKLCAYYLPAKAPTKRFVLLSHGHHSTGMNEFSHITPFYHDVLGYNILLPDHRGHGRSGGDWIGFAALDWPNVHLWVKYLTERFGEDIEVVLHGISMGAATVLLANNNTPPAQVKLVIEDCGFSSEKEEIKCAVRMFIGPFEPLIRPAERIGLLLQKLIAGFSAEESDPLGTIKNAKCPVLFIHGGKDKYVPTKFVHELYGACPTPKKKFVVPEAVHAFSYYVDPDGYNNAVIEFLTEHLGFAHAAGEPAPTA